MDIQTSAGRAVSATNVVLYLDISCNAESRDIEGFVATLYEGFAETASSDTDSLFHCDGNGYKEFQISLALIAFLFSGHNSEILRTQMDTWIYSLQTGPADTFRLRLQIRYKRFWTDFRFTTARFIFDDGRYISRNPTTMVFKPYSENQQILYTPIHKDSANDG